MFEVGKWVIDTKREIAPTICAVIPETEPTIYILQDSDTGEYYIADESDLIEYDKYWFDDHKKDKVDETAERQYLFLTGKEYEDYINDISGVVTGLIENVIPIADKYNVDRNNAMEHFSQLLSAMVQLSTFEHYGEGGD